MKSFVRRSILGLLIVLTITGFVAAKGKQEEGLLIGVEDIQRIADQETTIILDIRDARAYADGHIPGAILVPLPGVEAAVPDILDLNVSVITYCSCPAEESSLAAALKLRDAGVKNVYVLVGGYPEWVKQRKPIVRGENPL